MKNKMTEKNMPLCRQCGQFLRQRIPGHREYLPFKPWNYLWHGKCEVCGYSYNIYMESAIAENQTKITTLVAADHRINSPYFSWDTYYVLSGINIESTIISGGESTKWDKLFPCTSEVRYIMDVMSSQSFSRADFSFKNTIDEDQEWIISINKDSLWTNAPSSNYDTDDFVWGFTFDVSLKREVDIREHNELFLAEYELRFIRDSLKNSPLLEQNDYFLDDT